MVGTIRLIVYYLLLIQRYIINIEKHLIQLSSNWRDGNNIRLVKDTDLVAGSLFYFWNYIPQPLTQDVKFHVKLLFLIDFFSKYAQNTTNIQKTVIWGSFKTLYLLTVWVNSYCSKKLYQLLHAKNKIKKNLFIQSLTEPFRKDANASKLPHPISRSKRQRVYTRPSNDAPSAFPLRCILRLTAKRREPQCIWLFPNIKTSLFNLNRKRKLLQKSNLYLLKTCSYSSLFHLSRFLYRKPFWKYICVLYCPSFMHLTYLCRWFAGFFGSCHKRFFLCWKPFSIHTQMF